MLFENFKEAPFDLVIMSLKVLRNEDGSTGIFDVLIAFKTLMQEPTIGDGFE